MQFHQCVNQDGDGYAANLWDGCQCTKICSWLWMLMWERIACWDLGSAGRRAWETSYCGSCVYGKIQYHVVSMLMGRVLIIEIKHESRLTPIITQDCMTYFLRGAHVGMAACICPTFPSFSLTAASLELKRAGIAVLLTKSFTPSYEELSHSYDRSPNTIGWSSGI